MAEKNNRYEKDTMILVDKETQVKIKKLAKKDGRSIKEYLKRLLSNLSK